MTEGVKFNHWFFWSLLAAFLLTAGLVTAEPFGYKYMESHMWVPGSTTNQLLDLSAKFGRTPDLLIVRSYLGSSGTHFRLRLIQDNYELALGLTGSARGATKIATDMTAAEKDTAFSIDLGTDLMGCHIVPASGATYYGRFLWALAPAATDTIIFDAYKSVP